MKTNISATSLHAYRTTNLSASRLPVAMVILNRTKQGMPTAAFHIEKETGMKEGKVSGRLFDLKEMAKNRVPITIDGRDYEIHQLQNPVVNPETNKPCQAYCLVTFTTVEAGQQITMFN